MNKLIISFFLTFFTLFFIWYIVGYLEFGSDINNMHLDLYNTIKSLVESKVNLIPLADIKSFFIDKKLDLPVWLNWLNVVKNLLYYPIYIGANVLNTMINIVSFIINFIINPKFI